MKLNLKDNEHLRISHDAFALTNYEEFAITEP